MIDVDGIVLADLDLHADAQVLVGRQQMIDDVEAALAAGPVDRGDVDEAHEPLLVAQIADDVDDLRCLRRHRQLAIGDARAR